MVSAAQVLEVVPGFCYVDAWPVVRSGSAWSWRQDMVVDNKGSEQASVDDNGPEGDDVGAEAKGIA